jgi:hypothetical protein
MGMKLRTQHSPLHDHWITNSAYGKSSMCHHLIIFAMGDSRLISYPYTTSEFVINEYHPEIYILPFYFNPYFVTNDSHNV